MEKYSGIDKKALNSKKAESYAEGVDETTKLESKIQAYINAAMDLIHQEEPNLTDLEWSQTNLQKAIDTIEDWKEVLADRKSEV